MSTTKRFLLATVGLLLIIAAFGILTESGLRMYSNRPFNALYTAIGAPMFILGVWMEYKAGYKNFRPFKR